ncbi:MAG: beta-propeller fold lactonase family protein [Dehalococcoidales bacterium]|jgi:6-phosphogluconolactonase|nr:beta-propeller fold lactonase family protein [Dehalococcoidales bacterium]
MNWLVGTYSKRSSEGIYLINLNEDSGEMNQIESFENISPKNPSFLVIGNNNKVFLVGESSKLEPGIVCSYKIIGQSLVKIDEISTNGSGPCHLSINKKNNFLVVVNYNSGDFSTYKISSDSKFEFIEKISHEGSSINQNRQQEPHAHSITFLNNETFYICDLGVDKIFKYQIDPVSLKIIDSSFIKSPEGSGPRHFVINSDKNRAYSINELDSTISLFDIDANKSLNLLQSFSTIPENYILDTTTADIHFSKNEKYIYGSNRGHDSIAKFFIEETGTLIFEKSFSTLGKTPRNFSISNSGDFCLIANENTDDIYSFKIDLNGDFIPTGYKLSIPSPVCLSEIFKRGS